jgi:uncharacterized protein YjiS (DUF1127 family)
MFTTSILRPLVRKHKEKPDCDRTGILPHVLGRIGSEVGEWRRRLRDRRALATMSDRSLRDIGLTRYDADWEARKPFWRA